MDATVHTLAYFAKLFRFFAMWLAIYLVEKVYLQRYLAEVYLADRRPPSLTRFAVWCAAVEALAFLFVLATLYSMYALYKGDDNAFVIDRPLLGALLADWAYSTALFVCGGVIAALVVQNCKLFRYKHDGARGVRALAATLLNLFAVLMAAPFYRLA